MPYVELIANPVPDCSQAVELSRGMSDAMSAVAGKRREVTAVRIAADPSRLWSINGEEATRATAYLNIKITQGTNSGEEKAQLLRTMRDLLNRVLGEQAEASYIVIDEVPAENWGYDGASQAARKAGRL